MKKFLATYLKFWPNLIQQGIKNVFDPTYMKSEDLQSQNKLLIKQKKTNKETERNYLGKKNRKRKVTNISI